MENNLRDMLAAAYALDDESKRDFEQWQAKRQTMKRRSVPLDRVAERLERQQPRRMIRKTYDPQQQPMAKVEIRDLTAEELKRWNDWWTRRFNDALQPQLEHFAEIMGNCVTDRQNELVLQLRKKLSEMQAELAALRADLAIARSLISGDVTVLKGVASQTTRAKNVA
jgi:hypothetical protein